MKLQLTRLIPLTALVCLLLASCKKEDAVSKPSPVTTRNAQVVSMIGAMQSESDAEVADVLAAQDITAADVSACPVKTVSPSAPTYPRTVTLDYGTGCVDENGRTVSGKKYINLQADYKTAPGGTVTAVITFSNYYVDGVNISGNITQKVVAAANPGPLVMRATYHKTVSDGLGNTSSYIGVTNRTLIGGDVNGPKEDKVFQVQEVAYGVELSPDAPPAVWRLRSEPTNLPIKSGACLFNTQGAIHIALKDASSITFETLNYGNGTCDNSATLKVNGVPQTITLPFIFFTQHL